MKTPIRVKDHFQKNAVYYVIFVLMFAAHLLIEPRIDDLIFGEIRFWEGFDFGRDSILGGIQFWEGFNFLVYRFLSILRFLRMRR